MEREQEFTPEELEKARAAKRAYMKEYRRRKRSKELERLRQTRFWVNKAKEMEAEKSGSGEGRG